ncbi:DUF4221 family protein [Algoriphagus litoralis]|uniref:DUF4221 family protein n=1 Tax=Algoriphagus litoralis TaxID=2202829 RepID=UPI000DB9A4AF|nr:DUF4221 family protein [Algoriphagus litoralis]
MYKFTSKTLVAGLFSVLIFSCQDKKEEQKSYSLSASGEKIILPINDSTSNISPGLQYFEGGKPYLFSANWNTNSLQIYDLENQVLEKELVFEREGDQGIEWNYFHVQSLDSIFLFPPFGNRFAIIDTSGVIQNRIRFELPTGYSTIFPHNSYYVSPPTVIGKELIVKVRGDKRLTEYTQSNLDSMSLEAAINLETGAVRMFPPGFPNDYLSSGSKQLEYSIVNTSGKKFVSFIGDHRLYSTGQNSEAWTVIDAKSQFLDNQMPKIPKDVDSRGMSEYAFSKSRYESLVYDSFRKVFYRFGYPPVVFETDEELRALRTSPSAFVVMVFDKELQLLTETKFEAGTYFPTNFFVGEKGLYLSLSHPNNPEIKEDEMAFELIKLEGN